MELKYLSIILLVLNFALLIILAIMYYKLGKVKDEYFTLKRSKYRDSNKIVMLEYYIRNYKEGENIFTVFRDLSNLLYEEKDKDT